MHKKIHKFLKDYFFIFPSCAIYGGLENFWEYGLLGTKLKQNIIKYWNQFFVNTQKNIYLMDGSIFSSEHVWKASKHLESFCDVLIDCKTCKKRFRLDHLQANLNVTTKEELYCLECKSKDLTNPRNFNLMFGITDPNKEHTIYLRPETAQNIFINFKYLQMSNRAKVSFAVAQIGKAFRNEITVGQGIFRTREFEQMELEWFVKEDQANKVFDQEIKKIDYFLQHVLKFLPNNYSFYELPQNELAHYSKKNVDVQFNFEHGWDELWGLANRGNFDLSVHTNNSNTDLNYFDPYTKEKYLPHVIESSVGVNRLLYALITNCYFEEELEEKNIRQILKLPAHLAPYKLAIFPLTNKQKNIAQNIYDLLLKLEISVIYDDNGSIGKRYRRQDAIGTPYCLTIDFDNVDQEHQDFETQLFTIRLRDSMEQIKMTWMQLIKLLDEIKQIIFYFNEK